MSNDVSSQVPEQSSPRTPMPLPHQADQPIFHVPKGVLMVLGAILAIHALRALLDDGTDIWLVLTMAVIPARFAGFAQELPGGALASWTSLITHVFAHGDVMHLLINSASLLAFASAIERRIGTVRFLVFFAVCGIAGALAFLLLNPGLMAPMIGASGAISGMLGGVMRFFFTTIDEQGIRGLSDRHAHAPLERLNVAMQDRRLMWVIGTFILMNIAAQFGLGDPSRTGGIAWEAHIGGFLAGFFLFGIFDVAARNSPREEQWRD